MKNILFLLGLLFFANANAQVTEKTNATHHLVMQLTSNDTTVWKGLMKNLKNLKEGWGDSLEIEVVTHGPGIDLLTSTKTPHQQKVADFKKMGVRFVVCENTMKERKVTKDMIISEAEFVKMGIGEIILKQEQGWSYIKVGS